MWSPFILFPPHQTSQSLTSQGWVNYCWPKEQEWVIVTGCWYKYTNLCPGRIECSQQLKAADCSLTSMKCFTASPWTIPRTPLGEITTCYWETLIFAVTEKLCSPHRADIMPHWPQKQFRFSTHHANCMFACPCSTDPSNEPSELERAFWCNYRKCIHTSVWAVGSRTCPVWEDFSFICAFPTLVFNCFSTGKTLARYPVYLQIICPLLKYHCTAP